MDTTQVRYPSDYQRNSANRGRWTWNLLLLVPTIALFPPLYNRIEPRLMGIPFFYWFLIAMILVSAGCTYLVYRMTKDEFLVTDRPDLLSVDSLDEGARR